MTLQRARTRLSSLAGPFVSDSHCHPRSHLPRRSLTEFTMRSVPPAPSDSLVPIRTGPALTSGGTLGPRAIQCHRSTFDMTVSLIGMERRRDRGHDRLVSAVPCASAAGLPCLALQKTGLQKKKKQESFFSPSTVPIRKEERKEGQGEGKENAARNKSRPRQKS